MCVGVVMCVCVCVCGWVGVYLRARVCMMYTYCKYMTATLEVTESSQDSCINVQKP